MTVPNYMQSPPRTVRKLKATKMEASVPPPPGPFAALLEPLEPKERHDVLATAAAGIARDLAADLVHEALMNAGKSLRQLQRESGIEPAVVSRVATGAHKNGPALATLAQIALSVGKTLHVSFEDPIPDED